MSNQPREPMPPPEGKTYKEILASSVAVSILNDLESIAMECHCLPNTTKEKLKKNLFYYRLSVAVRYAIDIVFSLDDFEKPFLSIQKLDGTHNAVIARGEDYKSASRKFLGLFEEDGIEYLDLYVQIKQEISRRLSFYHSLIDEGFKEMGPEEIREMYNRLLEQERHLHNYAGIINTLKCEKADFAAVVEENISQLQKEALELRNTRTFLGQSKTIKGIRQRVEKVILNLWKAVHPDQVPPVGIQPPEPWPEPPQKKAEYLGSGVWRNPPPDYDPMSGPPPSHDPPRN